MTTLPRISDAEWEVMKSFGRRRRQRQTRL